MIPFLKIFHKTAIKVSINIFYKCNYHKKASLKLSKEDREITIVI